MTAEEIVARIEAGIPGSKAQATDLGGGNHWRAEVVAAAFEGKSLVERHQMIYALFRDKMLPRDESIHALSLKTQTPAEAGQA
ncbi:MAG: BolA family transcriptional regulator [Planctomycetota bacterium]|nr:MAG: BolA family transcriptional regulator [Planctomycetota bacterium]